MRRRRPSDETLVTLRGKLEDLATRSVARQHLLQGCADLHGVSVATIYWALHEQFRPRSLHRRDCGRPRWVPQQDMERFCELIAAMKLRTTNQKGRYLSTAYALELLVERADGRDAGRAGAGATGPADPHDGKPVSASVGAGRRGYEPTAPGAAVPGGTRHRVLAVRPVAVGPQASAGAALDRVGPRSADPHAVQPRRYITSTRRATKPKPICGCAISWPATMCSSTGRASIPAPRIGRPICRRWAFGPCAPRTGSVLLRASPSAAGSASMPKSRWTGSATNSTLPWPARRSRCGGGCSITNCSLSTPTSGSGRSDPSMDRSRCTVIAASANPQPTAASTGSRRWRASSACRARRWTGQRHDGAVQRS